MIDATMTAEVRAVDMAALFVIVFQPIAPENIILWT